MVCTRPRCWDRAGAKVVLAGLRARFPQVGLAWVDGGYVNSVDASLVGWVHQQENLRSYALRGTRTWKASGYCPRPAGR